MVGGIRDRETTQRRRGRLLHRPRRGRAAGSPGAVPFQRPGGAPHPDRRRGRPAARPPRRGGPGGAGGSQRPAPDLLRQAHPLQGPRTLPRRRLQAGGAGLTGRLAAVTGATGFLGRQIVRALAADGWSVRVLARRDPVDPLWRDLAPDVVLGDVADEAALS